MKKQILFFALLILMTNLVSATLTLDVPTQVKNQNNFDIFITGASSLYAVEIQIPTGFLIAADPANGIVGPDNIYRATYGSNLKLTLRAPKWENAEPGVFYFKGKYTEGAGVQTFTDKTIEVRNGQEEQITCPVCPNDTPWSACSGSQQSQIKYSCSEQTNYICVRDVQTKSCVMESNCNAGWVCADSTKLGLQRADCTYSTIVDCKSGCNADTKSCNPDASGNLITGAVSGLSEGKGRMWLAQFFDWIIGLLKGMFGMK